MDLLPPEILLNILTEAIKTRKFPKNYTIRNFINIISACSEWYRLLVRFFVYDAGMERVISLAPPQRKIDYVEVNLLERSATLFRREYHSISKEKVEALLKDYTAPSKPEFYRSQFSTVDYSVSLFLLVKYKLADFNLKEIWKYLGDIFDTHHLRVCYDGELIQEKYPNHYPLFKKIFEKLKGEYMTRYKEKVENYCVDL